MAEEDKRIVGWAGLGRYSERECYAGIGEASMYVDREARGRHVGLELATGLREAAVSRGYWKIIGLLLAENAPSLAFVEATGARVVGTFREHAQLDGSWRDVVIIEVLLR